MKITSSPSRLASGIRLHWNRLKSRLLLTYTLSYVLIFLVPLSLVTCFIYYNAATNLRASIEQANVNQLTQVQLSIDNQITSMMEIAGKISYDEHLTKYMISHPYHGLDAITALARYKTNNSIIEELFLYYRGGKKIYSSLGMTNVNVILGDTYTFEHWQKEEIRKALNETSLTTVRPAEVVTVHSRRESMLAMLVPIKINDPYPYATVLYLMKESRLTGVMNSILTDFSGSSYIFSSEGKLMTSDYEGGALHGQDLASVAGLEPGIHSVELDGERYSVVTVKSLVNGWTYATAMPSYQFFEQVGQIRTIILLVFGFTVIIGLAVAMLLARRQYHPIRDLLELASFQGTAEHPGTGNEWEWIKQTINEYHARIDMQEPYVRKQCLLLLFKHGKPEDPEIERMIAQSGLKLPENAKCFTVIVNWDEQSLNAQSWQIRQQLLARFGELTLPDMQAWVSGVEFSSAQQLALMVTLLPGQKEQDEEKRLTGIVNMLDKLLSEQLPGQPNFGVGTVYHDLSGLHLSFLEAASALDQGMCNSNSRITYFKKLTQMTMRTCTQTAHHTEATQPTLLDKIVAYVEQSYADYTLSLEHVALKYDISTSYLSRSFKDKTGHNFSQYIWQLRLNEVIYQLIHTSAPLKEIIERVGYLDAPSFIRKFKREIGHTPGQYRKLHK